MSKPPIQNILDFHDQSEEFFDRLLTLDDMSCVIITASYLNAALGIILTHKLGGTEEIRQVVRENLHSLWLRTKIIWALGLISEQDHDNLKEINTIRNNPAHDYQRISFSQIDIKNMAMKLKFTPPPTGAFPDSVNPFNDARKRFAYSSWETHSNLLQLVSATYVAEPIKYHTQDQVPASQ